MRNIWRLAIDRETSTIPSLFIFRSRIRNQIERRMQNRKSRESMWPSINYKEKTSTYLVPRVLFNLELIDMAQRLHILENFLQKQRCRGNATCFVCHSKFKPSEINDSYNVKRCYRLQLRYRGPLYANFVPI